MWHRKTARSSLLTFMLCCSWISYAASQGKHSKICRLLALVNHLLKIFTILRVDLISATFLGPVFVSFIHSFIHLFIRSFIHFSINHIRIHKNMQEIYNIFTMIDNILNKLFYKCSEQ